MPRNPAAHIRKKLDRGFPRLDNNPKDLYDITKMSFEAERSFSALSITKNKL
jgi:hypothetical protein